MKKIAITIISLIMFIMTMSTSVSALGQLPGYELPKVEDLEKPHLSKDYGQMKGELLQQWQNITNSKKEIPFTDTKAYIDSLKGKTSFDLFKNKFGDAWSVKKKQYSKKIDIPSDKYFTSYINTLSQEAQKKLDVKRSLDSEEMNQLLKKVLDTSKIWNLDDYKNKVTFMDSKQVDEYLTKALKPAGWDDIKKESFVDKSGGFDIPIISDISDGLKEIYNIFGFGGADTGLPGALSGDTKIEDILGQIKNSGGSATDKQLKDLKEAASKESLN